MVKLKTYSISVDITASVCASNKLHTEIKDSGYVNNFRGLIIQDDVLDVYGDSLNDGPSLDTLVRDHNGVEFTKLISPPTLTSNVINWNPEGWEYAEIIEVTSNHNKRTIAGFPGTSYGDTKKIINISPRRYVTLLHNSAQVDDGNHILCGNRRGLKIPPNGVVDIRYFEDNYWRVIGKSW